MPIRPVISGAILLVQWTRKALSTAAQPSTEEQESITRQCLGLLRAAVRKPAGRRALRTLQVGALLHAALRWNRTQKLNANDMFDFHHAGAALGYCDVQGNRI